jgi:parallel beta-helix repeat protein
MKKGIFCVLVTILMISCTVIPISSKTTSNTISQPQTTGSILYVGGSGPNNYTKIQDAINDSNNGDTIYVYDDLSPYIENLIINKIINLIGENKNSTIIDGTKNGNAIELNADDSSVQGFTIKNASGYYLDCGLNLHGDACNIFSNIFTSNEQAIVINGANVNISHNSIIGNELGIELSDGWNRVIYENYIAQNSEGIDLVGHEDFIINNSIISNTIGIEESPNSIHNTIRNNLISENSLGIEVHWNHHDSIISNNRFIKNEEGLDLNGENNIIEHNLFVNNSMYGLRLNNYNIISHNDFFNNGIYPGAIYRGSLLENNTVNGKPLIFLLHKTGIEISDAGQVILYNCLSINIMNMDLSSSTVGLTLYEVNDCYVENCTFSNNNVGCMIINSNSVLVVKNRFSNNQEGIKIYQTNNLSIHANDFLNNTKIIVFDLDYTQIHGVLSNNYYKGKITKLPKFIAGRVKTRFTRIDPFSQREVPIYRIGFLIDANPKLLPDTDFYNKKQFYKYASTT